ncbi:AfsA-related hotdog domain-containing protein [Pendulispora albinea]|uniref:A-factor biosynthesis hotdog domain-containing protein n=1 Tax=Pendulispora albinea TaxID=2741071 RepID=A0ABZ2LQ05_9BACT
MSEPILAAARRVIPIDKTLVHKTEIENVFVSDIHRVDGRSDLYEAEMVIDTEHAFFFEHPLDHVPGLMLVEAVRQMGTAVSHIYYGAPKGSVFVLNDMRIVFSSFGELNEPLFMRMRIHDTVERKGKITQLQCASSWWQSNQQIGTMDAKWSVFDARTIARLRSPRRPSPTVPASSFETSNPTIP